MMDLREILAEGSLLVWMQLAEEIAKSHDIQILQSPETCTLMMQAIDSVGLTPFYLGEVLLTETSVSLDGIIGFGFALEDEPERAICGAIIDAALRSPVAEVEYIRRVIAKEEQLIRERLRVEGELVASTKVNFAIMEG
jgi:alpha-D-ribose 1-methylphosphonate 5-triphosphate synthase subunit PhnG